MERQRIQDIQESAFGKPDQPLQETPRQVQDRLADFVPPPKPQEPLTRQVQDRLPEPPGFDNGGPIFSISDPFEDEMERRKTTEEMLQELLASDQSNLSGQDLQTISELVNKTENQPYQMV